MNVEMPVGTITASHASWFVVRGMMMRSIPFLFFVLAALGAIGCTHSFAQPVVATLHTQEGVDVDVAWLIEDEHHVVRCVNGPEGPVCTRAAFR